MTKKLTIAIDAMGGDHSPKKVIHGVEIFLKKILQILISYYIYLEMKEKLIKSLQKIILIRIK